MTKKIKAIIMTLLTVFSLISVNVTAFAATNDPYAYIWDDAGGVTHYQFYEYSSKDGAHIITTRYTGIGDQLFTIDGAVVAEDIKAGKDYVSFDNTGTVYIVDTSGRLITITKSGTNTVYKDITYKSLKLDDDDIVTAVVTDKGTVKIKDLGKGTTTTTPSTTEKPATSTTTTDTTKKSANRVERTGDTEQTVTAYANNALKIQLIVKGSKVLDKTHSVRLSDIVKGAKFLGVSDTYDVLLYETSETGEALYRFVWGNWYSPEKLYLEGNFKSIKEDANGFVSEVITTKKTYKVADLSTTSAWTAKKTYAVNKGSYATLYVKGKKTSHTLKLSGTTLTLDEIKVTSNVKEFGFVNGKTFIVKKKNNVLYTGTIKNPSKLTKLSTVKKGTTLVASEDNGLITYTKKGNVRTKISFK
jgi:hypothetical protein